MDARDEIAVWFEKGDVAVVEIRRPPANYFDTLLLRVLADLLEDLDQTSQCRAVVLCSQGKHFCAGAKFTPPAGGRLESYRAALSTTRASAS